MDQESAKKGSAVGQGTWRDKLGIKKELPKISAEFAVSPRNAAPERREPSLVAAQVRAGTSVKPAPMAPRIASAARTPAPQAVANTELAERIRQQREAAERMAEQRIAEAKDRAVRPSPPPEAPSDHQQQSARPRFSFADEELKQRRQEPIARAQAAPGRWTQTPQPRPIFSAERFASAPSADPRLGGLSAGQRPAAKPGAMPYAPPLAAPAPPRRAPPPPRPPAGESGWGQGVARQRSSPSPVFDSYRRDAGQTRGHGQSDPYMDESLYRDDRGRADAFRDQNDYRGAHARELSSVEDHGDDLFEDEQGAPPRRADARDYNQAYREYEVTYAEQPRRRMAPLLSLLALLALAAIAGAAYYLYPRDGAAPLLAKGEDSVPVVAGDGQPVKAKPEIAAESEEPAASKPSGELQVTSAPSGETSAQRKQIYDRILGETTLEEQEQLAPAEEQPLRPLADPTSGPSLETQTDAASGQALDAEPLPLPPPPGGSPEDETGGLDLDLTGQSRTRAEGPGPPDAATSPVPASATPSSTGPVVQSAPTPPTQPIQQTTPTILPEKPAPGRAAAAEGSEEILSDNNPEQDLIVSGNSSTASAPPSAPAPPVDYEPALSGAGPVLITPQPGGANQPIGPTIATLPPAAVPDETTIRKSRVGSRGSKSADFKGTSTSGSNFGRQASQQQVASIEPELMTSQIAPAPTPAPAPQPLEQQAALPPTQPPPSEPAATAPAGPGFVMLFSSHRSEAEALAEFERLRRNHAGLIGSLTPGVRKTNLGSSGTRYQLSLGVIRTRDEAKFLCSALFSAGEKDCIVRPR